jgi:cyclic pyranopterin phosphate synthase
MRDEAANRLTPVEMVDVSQKPIIPRRAEARGVIRLHPPTVNAIRQGHITKGNVLAAAEIAGILAAKRTSEILPLCHQIPLSQVTLSFEMAENRITARCSVVATYTTGVEMEALVGVATALLTIWDMVKYLEKDAEGQYPDTRIEVIQVTEKWKDEE